MFPAMVFCILSSDRDFVDDMTCLLCDAGVDVYVASSFDEYAALQADGVALADRGDPREDLGFVLPDPQRFRDHPLGRHWTLTVTVNAQCLIARCQDRFRLGGAAPKETAIARLRNSVSHARQSCRN